MMKWWEEYEFASDLYDAVQAHQLSFKNLYVYPKPGTYLIHGHSIEFLYPRTFPNGFIWERYPHKIILGKIPQMYETTRKSI